MVNPGSFRGSRFQFLVSQKAEWERAVDEGFANEALLAIQRKYFKRYPIDLPHDIEPSEEHLATVDDDAADLDADISTRALADEMVVPVKGANPVTRGYLIKFRKAQIHRWLQYQYSKDHTLTNKDTGASNPYSALLLQLTGKDPNPPRKKSATNLWRKSEAGREAIEKQFKIEVDEAKANNKPIPRSQFIGRRDAIARRLFKQLSKTQQAKWEQDTIREKEKAKAAHELEMKSPISTKPEDRQRAIQTLPQVLMPILDFITEVTGWKATLLVGGPEPAQGGQLNLMSIHSGTTNGTIPMNFGQAERERYADGIVPIFGSFLKKCYTPTECRSRALPRGVDMMPLSALEPGTEDDPHALGGENPRAFLHAINTGLDLDQSTRQDLPSTQSKSSTMDISMTDSDPSASPDRGPFPFNLRDELEDWPESRYSSSVPPSPARSRSTSPDTYRLEDPDGVQLRRGLPPPGLIITQDGDFNLPDTASAAEQGCPVMYLPTVQFVTAGGYTSLHAASSPPTNQTNPVIDPVLTGQDVFLRNESMAHAIIQSTLSSIPLLPAQAQTISGTGHVPTSAGAPLSTAPPPPSPSSTGPPFPNAIPSSTGPSTAIPSSTGPPFPSSIPSSTGPSTAIPSSTGPPFPSAIPSSTGPSAAIPSSTGLPFPSAIPSSTGPPFPSAIPSSTGPSAAIPSSTGPPFPSSIPSEPANPNMPKIPKKRKAVEKPEKAVRQAVEQAVESPAGTDSLPSKRKRTKSEKAMAMEMGGMRRSKAAAKATGVGEVNTKERVGVEDGRAAGMAEQGSASSSAVADAPKRGRGRPKKVNV